ncbi:MAG: hypothetical protein DRR19_10075 [Candidatus Parabeggiatoa sp. nov. 1]|nr:MAG: hypothetical protein DRR19_10075 [Gammaproteobacteria bacterium]
MTWLAFLSISKLGKINSSRILSGTARLKDAQLNDQLGTNILGPRLLSWLGYGRKACHKLYRREF